MGLGKFFEFLVWRFYYYYYYYYDSVVVLDKVVFTNGLVYKYCSYGQGKKKVYNIVLFHFSPK